MGLNTVAVFINYSCELLCAYFWLCVGVPADPALGCVGVVLDGDDSPVGAAGAPPTGAAGSEPPTVPSLSTGIP